MKGTAARRLPESCPCRGSSLDRLVQPAVLGLLARGRRHGYALVEGIASLEERRPDPAGVYRTLRAMERRGLVAGTWDLSVSGPPRRVYAITPLGRECLRRWAESLKNHHRLVGRLLAELRDL